MAGDGCNLLVSTCSVEMADSETGKDEQNRWIITAVCTILVLEIACGNEPCPSVSNTEQMGSLSARATFFSSQHNGSKKSDVYRPVILFRRFLSLPLAAGRLLSLQFLREGPQKAHKMLIPVSCSYTLNITLKFTEKNIMKANSLYIPSISS